VAGKHTDRPFFTVLTATYQGARTLPDVYRCLCAQTCRDFEWIVVVDGSTDESIGLVEGWIAEARISVQLHKQENAGKFRAIDAGVALARGELLVILDDDDLCLETALERFRALWLAVPAPERQARAGVLVTCQTEDGRPVGNPLPDGLSNANFQTLMFAYGSTGERWAAARVDLHRRFTFPEVPAPIRFLPEGLVWLPMSRAYPFVLSPEPLRVFRPAPEGLSGRVARVEPAMLPGLILYHRMVLTQDFDWLWRAPKPVLTSAVNLVRYRLHQFFRGRLPVPGSGLPLPAILLVWLMLPVGIAAYVADRLRL
jgi:glycosyltransferase involved in cell wall biosynthesis